MNKTIISGCGMTTSLGNYKTACAAARAGISRAQKLSVSFNDIDVDEGISIIGNPVWNTTGYRGFGRLVRLGVGALNDLNENLAITDSYSLDNTGLIINLSNNYFEKQLEADLFNTGQAEPAVEMIPNTESTVLKRDYFFNKLIPRLLDLADIQMNIVHSEVLFKNEAGIIDSIQKAIEMIKDNKIRRCIVGGIDSLVDENIIKCLSRLNFLNKSDQNIIPGEGACFLLVESESALEERNGMKLASIGALSYTEEPHHMLFEAPSKGKALAQAIQNTLRQLENGGKEIGLIVGSFNGTKYSSTEWGNCLINIPQYLHELPCWFPTEFFGDTGAAVGFISACLVCRGFARNYIRSKDTLVWASSPEGRKCSMIIRSSY